MLWHFVLSDIANFKSHFIFYVAAWVRLRSEIAILKVKIAFVRCLYVGHDECIFAHYKKLYSKVVASRIAILVCQYSVGDGVL